METSDITLRILIISITKIRAGREAGEGEGEGEACWIIFVVLLNHTHFNTAWRAGEYSGTNYDNSGALTEDLLNLLFLGEGES